MTDYNPEDDTIELDGLEEDEVEEVEIEPFSYDDDSPNLVQVFSEFAEGRDAMKEISSACISNFDSAWESFDKRRKEGAESWRLFAGDLPVKEFPYDGCANAHVPSMQENITRVHARIYGELFGDWTNVVGVIPIAMEDETIAEALNLHSNWQFREQIVDFPRQADRGIQSLLIWGDVTCHSFWDPRTETNRHEMLTPGEFVTSYEHISVMPDYSDVTFLVKVMYKRRHDLEAMRGQWMDVDKLLNNEPPTWDQGPTGEILEAVDVTTSVDQPDDLDAPYKILHYEGWMTLPLQVAQRYVQVIVDHETGIVLKLVIHEEEDWRDQQRFANQTAEKQAFDAGQIETPEWMEFGDSEPEPIKSKPIHMFAHGVAIENMLGTLGMSYGKIQADFNKLHNALANQFLDSATLANTWGIIASDDVQFDGDLDLSPGAVNKVHGVSGPELKASIMEMKPAPANPQMIDFMDKSMGWAQSSLQSPDVLSGEPGKSGETFKGLNTRIEQATKQLSVFARKTAAFFKVIFDNNARLNAKFLPTTQIVQIVQGATPQMAGIKIAREMYERGYKFEMRADLEFTSREQKIERKREMLDLSMNDPDLIENKQFRYAALKAYLEARGSGDLVAALGPPPLPSQVPFGAPPPLPPGEGGGEPQ